MEPKPPRRVDAPKASSFPRLDEHLVRPETREEMIDGRLVLAPPALEPHAERHFELDYVTGTRYIEELAFEAANEQSMADVTVRARDLTARGVRRIIAIFVKTNEVRDWSPSLDDWITFDPNGAIVDRTLATAVPVRALLDGAAANRAVVRALHAKRDPAILEIEAEGRAQMARTAIAASRHLHRTSLAMMEHHWLRAFMIRTSLARWTHAIHESLTSVIVRFTRHISTTSLSPRA